MLTDLKRTKLMKKQPIPKKEKAISGEIIYSPAQDCLLRR